MERYKLKHDEAMKDEIHDKVMKIFSKERYLLPIFHMLSTFYYQNTHVGNQIDDIAEKEENVVIRFSPTPVSMEKGCARGTKIAGDVSNTEAFFIFYKIKGCYQYFPGAHELDINIIPDVLTTSYDMKYNRTTDCCCC